MRIDLIARIEASFSQQTPSGKHIAGWLLNNLAQIPFESADTIAGYIGTTGITVGRYLRKLGYRNLEDVKASLRADALAPYPPLGRHRPVGCMASSSVPSRIVSALLWVWRLMPFRTSIA